MSVRLWLSAGDIRSWKAAMLRWTRSFSVSGPRNPSVEMAKKPIQKKSKKLVTKTVKQANATATPLIIAGDLNVDLCAHPGTHPQDPSLDTHPVIRKILPPEIIARVPYTKEAGGKIHPSTATRYHDEGQEAATSVIDGIFANGWALNGMSGGSVEAATRHPNRPYRDHVPVRTTIRVQDIKHATDATAQYKPAARYKRFAELTKTEKDAMVQEIVSACNSAASSDQPPPKPGECVGGVAAHQSPPSAARALQAKLESINDKFLKKKAAPPKQRKPGINGEITQCRQAVAILLDEHAKTKKAIKKAKCPLEAAAKASTLKATNAKIAAARALLSKARTAEAARLAQKHEERL
eukprot:gene1873-4387_t